MTTYWSAPGIIRGSREGLAHFTHILDNNYVWHANKNFTADTIEEAIDRAFAYAREELTMTLRDKLGDERLLLTLLALDGSIIDYEAIQARARIITDNIDYRWRPERYPQQETYRGTTGIMFRMTKSEQLLYLNHEAEQTREYLERRRIA